MEIQAWSLPKIRPRRAELLTLGLGLAGAALAAWLWSPRAGAGVAAGGVLAWLNGRWLDEATRAISTLAAAQSDAEKPRVSPWVYVKLFARYALIGVVIYVMFSRFAVPVVSVLAGLLSLGAAVILDGAYETAVRAK